MSDQAYIVTDNLRCIRDDRVLFSALSFSLNPGDVLQVEGMNGSGKTSLLKMLVGLLSDDEGRISYPRASSTNEFFQDTLYLGHLPGVKQALSAVENLRFLSGLNGYSDADYSAALDAVGLAGYDDVLVGCLSAGQKRRVALARLYVEQSKCWILDEPFAALDKRGIEQLEKLFVKHQQSGGAVLVTTHHEFSFIDGVEKINLHDAVYQQEEFT